MIKVIAFDYGGVIKINEQDLVKEISNYLNINIEEFKKEYFSVNHLFNIEGRGFEEVTLLLVSRFDNSEETKKYILELLKENESKYHLNTELIEIIKELKARNYKIALLSNNSLELRLNILFKELGVQPSEVVFIDDSRKSLEGADKIGYIPLLFKNNESLKMELANLLSATPE